MTLEQLNGTPPSVLEINYENVPHTLRDYRHWVGWHYEHKPDQSKPWAKVPIQLHAHTLRDGNVKRASTNNNHSWVAWGTALDILNRVNAGNQSTIQGLGFCVGQSTIVGIDLDHCCNSQTGVIDDWARSIVDTLNTYTEYSPSGSGLRLLCFGTLPETTGRKYRNGPVEMYDRSTNRYLTITGQRVPNTPDELEERTDQLADIHNRFIADSELTPDKQNETDTKRSAILGVDAEILALAKEHHGERFDLLWSGDWQNEYSSQSEADLSLVGLLAFYAPDEERLDGLFRQSGLLRDKWERDDYRLNTLGIVLDSQEHTYDWDSHKRTKDNQHLEDMGKQAEAIVGTCIADKEKNTAATAEPISGPSEAIKKATEKRCADPEIYFQSWDEIKAIAATQREDWWIEGWAEFGTLLLFTGLPFSGKSCITSEIIAAMSTGQRFAEMPIKKVPIVLFDLENRERTIVQRIATAFNGKGEGDIGKLLFRVPPNIVPRPLTTEYMDLSISTLRKQIGDQEHGVIIVDTMRSAFCADELSVQEMVNLLVPLKQLAYDTGWLVIVLHHNAKHSNQYSGSTAIAAIPDYLWNWTSNKRTREGMLEMEGRCDYQEALCFLYDRRNIFTGTVAEKAGAKREDKREHDLDELLPHCPIDWYPRVEICKASEMSESTFKRRVAIAVEDGLIEEKKDGRHVVIRLTEDGTTRKLSADGRKLTNNV